MLLFHNLSISDCFEHVKSSSQGLSDLTARHLLEKNGPNKLVGVKPLGKFFIFFNQFKNPLIILLLVAGGISIAIGRSLEAQIVFGAVLINAVIGFFQENKANNTLNQLKKLVEHKTIVRRAGVDREINSSEVVVGDILILRAGEKIPVDCRVIKSIDLQINEASLTGESNPIFKHTKVLPENTGLADRKNMVYSGTVVVSGNGEAVVVAKGQHTELGKISDMVRQTKEGRTPLQMRLSQLSKFISLIAIAASILIVIFGLIQGRNFFDIFLTAIAVAVAAVPEGLVVAVTVILTLGMKQILKQKALTRKLLAVETLGSVTVICTDKTGTLTEGVMQVARFIIGDKELTPIDITSRSKKEELVNFFRTLEIGLLCNNAILEKADDLHDEKIIGLPIEVALLKIGQEIGIDREDLLKKEPKIGELPFSSDNKFMITLHSLSGGNYVLYEKGAPERIIAKSAKYLAEGVSKELTKNEQIKLLNRAEELTGRGLRLIALAYKKIDTLPWSIEQETKDWTGIDNDLVFVGFIAFKDPLRVDAKETISLCRQAGIRPIIITGDHPLTAHAIAKEVGFTDTVDDIVTGEELDRTTDEALRIMVKTHNIYARVSPENKLKIVQALQANGEVVAMTGDGLNDSPALKTADIGVCLGSGTDVAKENSDIVLLDDNFKVIVAAVREGRVIFNNIRKSVTYLISDSFSEIFLIVGSIVLGTPLPILPAQILWVNIINDGFPNFSLAFENSDKDVMTAKPLKKSEPIVNREMKVIIIWLGLIRDFAILMLFFYLYSNQALFGWDINYLRTFFFTLLGFKSISGIFSLRSLTIPIYKIKHGHNPYLLGAFAVSLFLLCLAIYWAPLQRIIGTVPLSMFSWFLIFIASIINIFIIELIKHFFIVKSNTKK